MQQLSRRCRLWIPSRPVRETRAAAVPQFPSIMHCEVPPSMLYLILSLLRLSLPIFGVHVIFTAVKTFAPHVSVPPALKWTAYILVDPLIFAMRVCLYDYLNTIELKKRDAVIPPRFEGKWLGSVDIIVQIFKNSLPAYPRKSPICTRYI